MTLAGEALSKLYWYEVWLLIEPVNEARFANLLYCGIDGTGLLAVGCWNSSVGLVSGRGLAVRDCLGWSGVWPLVGLIVCIC